MSAPRVRRDALKVRALWHIAIALNSMPSNDGCWTAPLLLAQPARSINRKFVTQQ